MRPPRLVFLVASALAALLLAGPAAAEDPPPEPAPPPAEPVIAEGVKIGGVEVGGMTATAAFSVARTAFEAPLSITYNGALLGPTPMALGATGYVQNAVGKALAAEPGTEVELFVRVRGAKVRDYVAVLAKRFDRDPVDARVVLRKLRPQVTRERVGRAVDRAKAVAAIVRALRANDRLPMPLPVQKLRPKVTRKNVGPVVVIRRDSNKLFLYRGWRYVRSFTVATGERRYPTPLGRFRVVLKARNPWWYPPDSDWARDKEPVPPGPGNPLGTRWMGISSPGVGIHGTPDSASLGYSVSHGCVRMLIPQAEWLFRHVRVGTPVFIVKA